MPEKTLKPLKKKKVPVTLSIRFEEEDVAAIDREVARYQTLQPGIDFNRSGIVRMLVLQALRAPDNQADTEEETTPALTTRLGKRTTVAKG